MKKAQGLPINTIIIAALALVVLIILIGIVGFRTQKFGAGVAEATDYQECPSAQIKTFAECDEPLVGNYGKKGADVKMVPLPPGYVCCSS